MIEKFGLILSQKICDLIKTRKATGFKSLLLNCWKIIQVTQICQVLTGLSKIYAVLVYLILYSLLRRSCVELKHF